MAISQLTATAGHHSLPDLLFSPRAAFIWDHTEKSIAWMNAAARAKLKLSRQGLSDALPKALQQKLARCYSERRVATQNSIFDFHIPPLPAFPCSIERLKLASDHDGLIIAELEAAADNSKKPSKKINSKKALPSKKANPKTSKAALPTTKTSAGAVSQLTPEEWRSFKAIGRKVKKLCREKAQAAGRPQIVSVPPCAALSLKPIQPQDETFQTTRALLQVFDLVLLLDERFRIVKVESKSSRLGWRKAALVDMPAAQLVPLSEKAIFQRMTGKVASQASHVCRETLLVRDENGITVPCRTILGRWPSEGAEFFLAVLSLDLPHRLKRLQSQAANVEDATRLAA